MKIKGRYLLILIAMSGLIATSVGLPTNVAGLFFTPVAEEFGILKGSVSMTLTICNIVFALGGLVAPKLLKEDKLKAFEALNQKRAKQIMDADDTEEILSIMGLNKNASLEEVAAALKGE